jgi:hypothetical protein
MAKRYIWSIGSARGRVENTITIGKDKGSEVPRYRAGRFKP